VEYEEWTVEDSATGKDRQQKIIGRPMFANIVKKVSDFML